MRSGHLFDEELQHGALEQWHLSPVPTIILVWAKLLIYIVFMVFPVLFCVPLLALLFQWTLPEMLYIVAALSLGVPGMALICALSAATAACSAQRGVGVMLLVLPLCLPLMIFGSGVVTAYHEGVAASAYLALLAACSLLAALGIPWLIVTLIRTVSDQ